MHGFRYTCQAVFRVAVQLKVLNSAESSHKVGRDNLSSLAGFFLQMLMLPKIGVLMTLWQIRDSSKGNRYIHIHNIYILYIQICILMISYVHIAYYINPWRSWVLHCFCWWSKKSDCKLGIESARFAAPSVPARPETCGSERNSEKKLLQGVLHT